MSVAKSTVVPTKEPELMRWILKDPTNARTYIASEGAHWVNATRVRVKQVFGQSDPLLANSIAWEALAVLNSAAEAKKIDHVVALGPWLDGIIRHLVLKAFKVYVRGKKTTISIDQTTLLALNPDTCDAEESEILIHQVRECLSRLSPRERQILEMKFNDLEDPPTDKDVASALGISPGSVRTQTCTGHTKLIECLKKKGVQR